MDKTGPDEYIFFMQSGVNKLLPILLALLVGLLPLSAAIAGPGMSDTTPDGAQKGSQLAGQMQHQDSQMDSCLNDQGQSCDHCESGCCTGSICSTSTCGVFTPAVMTGATTELSNRHFDFTSTAFFAVISHFIPSPYRPPRV